LVLILLAACGGVGGTRATHHLTLGLTYIPDIQFAPFYIAQELGYYAAAGLDVTLRHHGFTESEFGAIVAGQENAIFAGGDEMLQARAQGQPLVYVAQIYTKYPVGLIVPAGSPIHSVADLRGHTIGIPGEFGETYFGLLSLLQSAGLSKTDVKVQSIGFTQAEALLAHKVDAAVGYLNNEPIQLQKAGFAVRTFPVSQPLISNGLAALESELSTHAADIRALVQATLQGVRYAIDHPQEAVTISKKYVPTINTAAKEADALAVLHATLPLWQPGSKAGFNDPAAWQAMETFLHSQGLLKSDVDVAKAYSNTYLPA
jgi:NitT/TauT family transport system substrate-binding protein